MPSPPIVPIAFSPARDTGNSSSPSNLSSESSTPSRSRISSRVFSGSVRGSRTPSLIIPVVSTSGTAEELEKDNDLVDIDVNLNDAETIQETDSQPGFFNEPSSPKLPARPPATPKRPNANDFKPESPEEYGMERVEGLEFSPASIHTSKTRHSARHDDGNDMGETLDSVLGKHSDSEPISVQNEKYLIANRENQIKHVVALLQKANLVVPDGVYFQKLRSSNSYIEVESELQAGSYDTGDFPTLFTLLLNSLRVAETAFSHASKLNPQTEKKLDTTIAGLPFLVNSSSEQKARFKSDISSIYSVLETIGELSIDEYVDINTNSVATVNPNALVAAFVFRFASKNILPQALVLALLLDTFIVKVSEESKEFSFLLLRAVEESDPSFFLYEKNPLGYVNSLIQSNEFWLNLVEQLFTNDKVSNVHPLGLTITLRNIVIHGTNSLVEVIVGLKNQLEIFGGDISKVDGPPLPVHCNILRYHREYTILNDSAASQLTSHTLEKLSAKHDELESILSRKKHAYDELLNNYKQLNEEKMSVSSKINKHKVENEKLAALKRQLAAQVEQALGQFDVIKQTMEKNRRVQELNETMVKEIDRLKKENKKLKS
ncbi:hypothetical protein BOH78_2784 [Pichia kudriavzevii]|uniref:Uncharacterized protein n=1 Tax=Pichia kudriavzevii TaxID=4909 RepID=A0A099NXV8_PICKU|nr:hypothetical protein JL09_g3448 [Pichia kudriavzevii]ONH73895.1 hypothetical protein BOH78_2784 [Pichia kudriavzevii]